MRIDSSGNVGIGITSPDQKLHVFKGSAGTVTSATDTVLTIENNANVILQFLSPAANEAVLLFGDPDNNGIGYIVYSHPTNVMSFSTNGTTSMTIDSNGRVQATRGGLTVVDANDRTQGTAQFAVTGSGYTLHNFLDGTAAYIGQNSNARSLRIYSGSSSGTGVNLGAGGTSWGTYSDERLKRNINDLGTCINKINSMRPITFNYISDEEDFKTRIGISAQSLVGQVDEALDLCKYSDEEPTEYYNVRYQDLIPVLVKGIQEQQAIIEELKATSTSQQTKIDALEARLTALESKIS